MKVIPYAWITWAAINAASGASAGYGYETAQAAGLGPVTSGAVTLAADTRALVDLNAAYGPVVAVLGPSLVTVASHVYDVHSSMPAALSVGLAALARTALSRSGGES